MDGEGCGGADPQCPVLLPLETGAHLLSALALAELIAAQFLAILFAANQHSKIRSSLGSQALGGTAEGDCLSTCLM